MIGDLVCTYSHAHFVGESFLLDSLAQFTIQCFDAVGFGSGYVIQLSSLSEPAQLSQWPT